MLQALTPVVSEQNHAYKNSFMAEMNQTLAE